MEMRKRSWVFKGFAVQGGGRSAQRDSGVKSLRGEGRTIEMKKSVARTELRIRRENRGEVEKDNTTSKKKGGDSYLIRGSRVRAEVSRDRTEKGGIKDRS